MVGWSRGVGRIVAELAVARSAEARELIIGLPDFHLMDIRRAHKIINEYSIAFFDRYLRSASAPLVDALSLPGSDRGVASSCRFVTGCARGEPTL
jgi:hypothetical protein